MLHYGVLILSFFFIYVKLFVIKVSTGKHYKTVSKRTYNSNLANLTVVENSKVIVSFKYC